VREDSEFDADRAAGARHLGRGVLERDIESLIPDRDADIVLYCGGGFRSALAAESLGKMGYRRVVSMDGGMRAWRAAGYPIDKPEEVTDDVTVDLTQDATAGAKQDPQDGSG
jgi:rhodanese-related sulfurtransferase